MTSTSQNRDQQDDQDDVVLTLPRGDRGEVRVARSRYRGRTFSRLQLWYPGEGGELRPGRQCITIKDHELRDVIGALQQIAARTDAPPDPRS